MGAAERFVVIGENIHATRIVRTNDARMGVDEAGREAIAFTDASGAARHLAVDDAEKQTTTYAEGRVKHVRVAIRAAMAGSEPDAAAGLAYLETIVRRQVEAGAHYLDLNVDEVSLELAEQVEAMRWLVRVVSGWTDVPVAVDSPSMDILAAGLEEAAACGAAPPMLNSASLERPSALDHVAEGGAVVVTATGESGMPNDADGRVENAVRIVELTAERGVPLDRIYVDPLVFPVAVNAASGADCLAAFSRLRERYGPELHLTGGMSNVSFGLPERRLLNDVFILLATEAGADSGIVDPIASPPARALALDRSSRRYELAANALTGADPGCRAYLKAYRGGELAASAATA